MFLIRKQVWESFEILLAFIHSLFLSFLSMGDNIRTYSTGLLNTFSKIVAKFIKSD